LGSGKKEADLLRSPSESSKGEGNWLRPRLGRDEGMARLVGTWFVVRTVGDSVGKDVRETT
jgi:hypothetical protein